MKKISFILTVSAVVLTATSPVSALAVLVPDDSPNKEVIYYPESGDVITGLFRSGENAYYYFGSGETMFIDGEEGRIAIDGTDFYIYNPVLGGITETWVKGTLGADGTVTIPVPQLISGGPDEGFAYYLMNATFDESSASATPDEENPTLKYTYRDGCLTLAEGCPSIFEYTEPYDADGNIIGDTKQWVWSGYITFSDEFKPYPGMGESAPASLKTTDYVMYSQMEGVTVGRDVKVGIDGKTVWVQGLEINVPEAWCKGELVDGHLVFRSQYMCFDPVKHLFQFLVPAIASYDDYDPSIVTGYQISEKAELAYDESNGSFVASDGTTLFVNGGERTIYALTKYENPSLRPRQPLTTAVPALPVILNYMPYNILDGIGSLDVALPQVNTAGELLSTERLYYQVLQNDDVIEVSEGMFDDISVPMTDIPYLFKSNSIMVAESVHSILFNSEINNLGVRMVYVDEQCERHMSGIVRVDSGLRETETLDSSKTIVDTIITDLSGCRLSARPDGICIVTYIYSDGTHASIKSVGH